MPDTTMWGKAYWKAVAERMLRGFAIGCLLIVGGNSLNAFAVDWREVLGFGLGGAALSLLFSLAGNVTSGNGPSFVRAEKVSTPLPPEYPADLIRPERGMHDDGTPIV